jgi:hypothetical protein
MITSRADARDYRTIIRILCRPRNGLHRAARNMRPFCGQRAARLWSAGASAPL